MSERSKFSKLMYLSNLDAINKYNLKSQFLVPSLLEISVELPLHRLGDIRTKSQKSFVVSKALNILLILFGSLPQIVYKNSKLSKKKKIYSLRYKLTNKKEIFSFLTLLFSFTSNEKGSSLFNLLKKRDSFINNHLNPDSDEISHLKEEYVDENCDDNSILNQYVKDSL